MNLLLKFFTKSIVLKSFTLMLFAYLFLVSYLTPHQSDDFFYHAIGLSFNAHLDHYLNWSGRFIADYLSSLLLYGMEDVLPAAVLSFSLVLMVSLIFKISCFHAGNTKKILLFSIVCFCVLWISIPTVGEDVFWVVGSCNYLYPTLFALIYIYLLNKFVDTWDTLFWAMTLVFAFLSGLSFESLAIPCVLYTIYVFISNLKSSIKLKIFLVLIVQAIGITILIAAPGNFIRLKEFPDFLVLSFQEKILHFIHNGLIYSVMTLKDVIALYLVTSILTFRCIRKNKSYIFFILSVISIFTMTFSPSTPKRAMMGAAIFIAIAALINICQIISYCFEGEHKNQRLKTLVYTMVDVLFVYVFLNCYAIYSSATRLTLQEELRQEEVALKNPNTVLPYYFWVKSVKSGDAPDNYYNDNLVALHYKLKKVTHTCVDFDYSVIRYYDYSNVYKGKAYDSVFVKHHQGFNNMNTYVFRLNQNQKVPTQLKLQYDNKTRILDKCFIYKKANNTYVGITIKQRIHEIVINGIRLTKF